MPTPGLLIVTRRDAQEVDGVIDSVRKVGVRVIRWNLCRFPGMESASYAVAPSPCLSILRDVTPSAGWIHSFGMFSVSGSLEALAREVALSECQAFTYGVLATLPCTWLNDINAIARASNKLVQLHLARTLCLPVAPTIVTSEWKAVDRFRQLHGACVVKAISQSYWEYGSHKLKAYTGSLARFEEGLPRALKYGPIIVQKEVNKSAELRVTVVGGRCFTIAFDRSRCPEAEIDVRQLDYERYKYLFTATQEWPAVERDSVRFVRELRLAYAALDWVVDHAGNAWFLECNPLGSFKWYELCGASGITGAIAEALLGLIDRES